jgi:hypothetical protein
VPRTKVVNSSLFARTLTGRQYSSSIFKHRACESHSIFFRRGKSGSSDGDGGNRVQERRLATKQSVGGEDNPLKNASNASRSSSSLPSSLSSSPSFAYPYCSRWFERSICSRTYLFSLTAHAAMRPYTICLVIVSSLVTRCSFICALRLHARRTPTCPLARFCLGCENVIIGVRLG